MTTIYHYDQGNHEYLGQSVAVPDPLVQGRALIPASATTKKPPAAGKNEAAVFDPAKDAWATVPDYRGTVYWLADGTKHTIDQLNVKPPDDALSTPPRKNLKI